MVINQLKTLVCMLLVTTMLLLSSCALRQDLFSEISESEANQMVAILRYHNYNATKVDLGKGLFSVRIIEPQFSDAIQLLRQWGYPKKHHTNFGELFQPGDLVPTRTSEQVRYIYGVSQELTTTLSLVEGVVEANVHVSLSGLSDIGTEDDNHEYSASVFILYDPDRINIDLLTPQIRALVAHSIPELTTDNVDLLSQPVDLFDFEAQTEDMHKIGNLEFRVDDVPYVFGFFAVLIGINFLLLLGLLVAIIRSHSRK